MSTLKFIKTKEPIQVQAPSSGLEFEYPSTFFSKKVKPQLIINNIYKTLDQARHAFMESLRGSKPDVEAGKEFAFRFLTNIKELNPEVWQSFGVTIAEREAEVTVLDLFDVVIRESNAPVNAVTGPDGTSDMDVPLLVIFCSIYRMGSIFDQAYLAQISDRIMLQAVGLPDDIPKPDALAALVSSWLSDINYLKMIAGIDMFLHHFPKSSISSVRIGTIASRYRDCASLLSIRFFMHIIGTEDPGYVPAWVTYEPIALDLIRMSKLDEEASEGSSYFPYQSDMGLVKKSAYSTVINPSYFFFVHGVGALLGLERSRNARMNLEYGVAGTVANVFLVSYIHKRNHVQTMQFTSSGNKIAVQGESPDTEKDGLTIRSNSPTKWAKFMETRDWVLTDFMKSTIKKMQQELIEAEMRPGTIGDFLSKHSIDLD